MWCLDWRKYAPQKLLKLKMEPHSDPLYDLKIWRKWISHLFLNLEQLHEEGEMETREVKKCSRQKNKTAPLKFNYLIT